jgi:hypothetical protein
VPLLPHIARQGNGVAAIPGTHTPPVVRGAYDVPAPAGAVPAEALAPDVFQSFNDVRAAMFVHCPAGLNRAIRFAHAIRKVR